MTAPRSDALNYDWTKARRDFENAVYPAVIAIRLGLSECDVWDRAQAEKWGGVYVRAQLLEMDRAKLKEMAAQ